MMLRWTVYEGNLRGLDTNPPFYLFSFLFPLENYANFRS